MARVFVARALPFPALDRLRAEHEVEEWPDRLPPPADRLAGWEGLLTMLTDGVDAGVMDASPGLRAISNFAVGVDNVDVEAATARGIPVGNTPDVLTDSTADLTVGLMLALMRRLPEGEAEVRAGEWLTWEPARLLGRDLHRATVLVVGPGRIGSAVARRVAGFGARVIEAGRGDPLEPALAEADVVTLHCPLTEETRGLIGAHELAAMKPGAYLVNTARGPIVDHAALLDALGDGAIAGAALDVTDPEPLPPGHPLLDAPNLVVVPHVASATHATRAAMAEIAVDNLLAGLRGEPMPHCVNADGFSRR